MGGIALIGIKEQRTEKVRCFYFTNVVKRSIIIRIMKIAQNWKDYSILATGDGYKLERWKNIILLRPDPQVIWKAQTDLFAYPGLCAYYKRSDKGGGAWTYLKKMPE